MVQQVPHSNGTTKSASNGSNTTPVQANVTSAGAQSDGTHLTSEYNYRRNRIEYNDNGSVLITPQTHSYTFRTQLKPNKTGLLLVGFGGNNGSTLLGSIFANKHHLTWRTKNGEQKAQYFGSITQSTTVHVGWDGTKQVHVPFNHILPMLNPNDLIIDGWDINNANMYQAMQRAKVFEPELQDKLRGYMEEVVPKPSIYYPDFIASNQEDRANNVIKVNTKQEYVDHIRNDIRQFKQQHNLDCVVVLWTASTERFVDIRNGLNTTSDEIISAISRNEHEISPSNLFAVASVLEGAHYINGSPQNSLLPGIIDLAQKHNVFVGGDDFKSGQTKLKSALVEFLVHSGLKPESIVSYNHLGNNDGKNLSEQRQFSKTPFRSKEISKSSVVDDMVKANHLLYPEEGKGPDHTIVIKYVPYVGDSKRAMDEYICSIFMGGQQTFAIHNTCEDSLLAAPLILDLAIITELASRIQVTLAGMPLGEDRWHSTQVDYITKMVEKQKGTVIQGVRFNRMYCVVGEIEIQYKTNGTDGFNGMHSVLSILSVLLKAPVVPSNTPVTNAFMKQMSALTKLLCACAGISTDNDLQLEFFTQLPKPEMNISQKIAN